MCTIHYMATAVQHMVVNGIQHGCIPSIQSCDALANGMVWVFDGHLWPSNSGPGMGIVVSHCTVSRAVWVVWWVVLMLWLCGELLHGESHCASYAMSCPCAMSLSTVVLCAMSLYTMSHPHAVWVTLWVILALWLRCELLHAVCHPRTVSSSHHVIACHVSSLHRVVVCHVSSLHCVIAVILALCCCAPCVVLMLCHCTPCVVVHLHTKPEVWIVKKGRKLDNLPLSLGANTLPCCEGPGGGCTGVGCLHR